MDEDAVVIPMRFRPGPTRVPTIADLGIGRAGQLLVMLTATRIKGMTWKEAGASLGLGHGGVSALLSALHKAETICRLTEKRENCKVYVMPEWVNGRPTERPRKTRDQYLLDDMADVLRQVPTKCRHYEYAPGCRSCQIKYLLNLYESR